MASFFEKLKRGMKVEVPAEEPKTEEPPAPPKKRLTPKFKKQTVSFEEKPLKESPKAEEIYSEADKFPKERAKKVKKAVEIEVKPIEAEKPEIKPEKIAGKIETKAERITTEKEKYFEPARQSFVWQNLGGPEGELAVDVYQTEEFLVIQSAIAGVKPENLDISIEEDRVLIKGIREKPDEDFDSSSPVKGETPGERNYFYQECYWGQFSKQIILPVETDPSRAQASMKEGILTIRIPKIERQKKRKIAVKTKE